MRRLLLLRHAKAEPGAAEQEDHDRTLTERGVADAAAMARYLRKQGYIPSRILCSTSLRTVQTVEPVLKLAPAPVDYLAAIYLAPPGRLMALAQDAADADTVLMLVGHNPGLENIAALLAREPVQRKERARHEALEEKFPTSALAILDFDVGRWRDVEKGAGKLVDFVRPKDL